MAKKFLDYSGLERFLDKIKSWSNGAFAVKSVNGVDLHSMVVDKTNGTTFGSMKGKTIKQLRDAIDIWHTANVGKENVSLKFSANSNFIELWNSDDITTALTSGTTWTLTAINNITTEHSTFQLTTYLDGFETYIVRKYAGVWNNIERISLSTDTIKASGNGNGVSVSLEGTLSSATIKVTGNSSGITSTSNTFVLGKDVYEYAATKDAFTGAKAATSSSVATAGTKGLVPAPAIGSETKFLRGDGIWAIQPNATTSVNGLMSSADKEKIDNLATVAATGSYNDLSDKPTIDDALNSTSTNPVQNKVINSALTKKQNTISDLESIRSGASRGAKAYVLTDAGIMRNELNSAITEELDSKVEASYVGNATIEFKDERNNAIIGSFTTNQKANTSIAFPFPSVENNLNSTSTTAALSAAQGKFLNEKFGVGVYDLGAFFNYNNGCLIELGELATATMVTMHITGYAYFSAKPYDSLFVFYDWVNNSNEREIVYYGGLNLGYPLGLMKVYHYNNKIYVWIKQTGDFQTLSFRVHSNRTGLSPTVTNSSIHTSGVTLLTEIEPENPLSASTESSDGLMESTDKKNLNTIKKWYDNIVGVDEDKVINKWDEIVSFLSGIPEGDTLYGLIEAVKTQVGDLKDDIEDGTVIAKEATTLGHETIGSTTKPIYLTSGVAKPCTYTLGTSVPSDAKFTDNNTTYSFASGTNKFTVTPSGGTAQEVSVTPSITNNVTYSGTLTSGQVAVLDGTAGKIKASGYTIAKSVPSNAVFTDTHYTAKNVVSNSASSTANVAASNGDVHINLVENNTCRSGIKIVGSGATQVVSDEWGNITITSDDTNTTYVAMKGATSSANGKEGLVPKPLYGSENAFLRGDGTWSNRINEFGHTGAINIGTSFSNATGWFRIARARYLRSTPSVFRVAIYRNYSYAVPEAYVFDVCTSYHTYDPISITQVSGQASTIDGNKLIDKIRVTRDTSSTDSIVYFDFHVNLSKTGNQFFWYVIGNAFSYTESEVVRNPTLSSTIESYEFTTVNGFKTNGDIYEGDSTLSSKYALTTKGISTSASDKGVKVTLGGTVGSPTVSVTTTTGGIASNNTGVVSGAAVKEYVDANKGVSTVFKAQTSSSNAENGLVPAPSSANATKFLRGDGSWQTPTNTTYSAGSGLSLSGTTFSLKTGYTTTGKNYKVQLDSSGNPYVNVPWTDTNTTYSLASTGANGLMSSAHVSALNNALTSNNDIAMQDGKTITLSKYGARKFILSGQGGALDISDAESGGWAMNLFGLKMSNGNVPIIGVYGNNSTLNSIFLGGSYTNPYIKMLPTGEVQIPNLNAKASNSTKWNGYNISVVTSKPTSPNSSTIYFVKS